MLLVMVYVMPKVVADQRAVFESNELFRRLINDSEIKYAGFLSSNVEERRARFQSSCQSGKVEITFVNCGLNLVLQFFPYNAEHVQGVTPSKDFVNFEREPGKVHLQAPFVLNGVCVRYKGWINLMQLDGMGHLEFDDAQAMLEATQLPASNNQQIEKILMSNSHALKHPTSGGRQDDSSKRPRLC